MNQKYGGASKVVEMGLDLIYKDMHVVIFGITEVSLKLVSFLLSANFWRKTKEMFFTG